MAYLVTGATGFLGGHVVNLLLDKGTDVRLFIRSERDTRNWQQRCIECIVGDITDVDKVNEAVRGCEGVFHCAGLVGTDATAYSDYYAINVIGTRNVCEAVLKWKVPRLVYTSSADTIGSTETPTILNESSVLEPNHYVPSYVASKCEAEKLVLSLVKTDGLPAVITNPAVMLGAGGKALSSRAYLLVAMKGLMRLVPAGGTNFVSVGDVAVGHLYAMQQGTIGSRYIMGGVNLSYLQFFRMVAEWIGTAPPIAVLPARLARFAGQMGSLIRSVTQLRVPLSRASVDYVYRFHYVDSRTTCQHLGFCESTLRSAVEASVQWLEDRVPSKMHQPST